MKKKLEAFSSVRGREKKTTNEKFRSNLDACPRFASALPIIHASQMCWASLCTVKFEHLGAFQGRSSIAKSRGMSPSKIKKSATRAVFLVAKLMRNVPFLSIRLESRLAKGSKLFP